MANNLAEALVKDIADQGLANLEVSNALRSIDGDVLVEVEQEGDTILVYENGDQILDLSTADEDFNARFLTTLATSLNF